MHNLPDPVSSYLNSKSENDREIVSNCSEGIHNIIVVPAICEFENIKPLLQSIRANDPAYLKNTLILFVINNAASVSEEIRFDNKQSLELLNSIVNNGDSFGSSSADSTGQNLKIGLIDASSPGSELDEKNAGVGLARKIGMDAALGLFDYSSTGKNLLICLDADCKVSENYLEAIIREFNRNNYSASTIYFEHDTLGECENTSAIVGYEIFLRYYVLGLRYAASPFAFHSVGSTIVCDPEAYIKVGGMNKKKGGEDFYFLQKLSKIYKINHINSTTVLPSSRSSWRVPFGTGKNISDTLQNKSNNHFLFDPSVFKVLKDWLIIFNSDIALNPEFLLKESESIHRSLFDFLTSINFVTQWESILKNSKTEKQLNFQRKNWFDGFTTLKLLHHLRDTAFPNIKALDALNEFLGLLGEVPSFKSGEKSNLDLMIHKEYLMLLRKMDKENYILH